MEEISVTVDKSDDVIQNVKIYLLGDVNKNGTINAMDMKRLLNHIKGINPLDTTVRGDINKNGSVNAMDMKRLLNHIKGKNPLF